MGDKVRDPAERALQPHKGSSETGRSVGQFAGGEASTPQGFV